jgi:hypothetical protein
LFGAPHPVWPNALTVNASVAVLLRSCMQRRVREERHVLAHCR